MNYSVIDIEKWERGKLFNYFMSDMRSVMTLTADVDIAPLIGFTKKNDVKFYPAMLWVVSKVLNSHDEFKYAFLEDGKLIKWDSISPSYANFSPEDENFTRLVTEYADDIFAFNDNFVKDKERTKDARGILEEQPKNCFEASCLPWVKYSQFELRVYGEGKSLTPIVVWGKYEKAGEKLLMPLTLTVHHAVADGFHLSRFFNDVQQLIDSLK